MLKHNQRGQGLIEYLIIVAIMAVGALSVMRVLGHNVKIQFTNVVAAISGDTQRVNVEKIKSSHYDKNDMSDFFKDATNK